MNLADEAQWYKDAIIYEVHVRAFHDGNGDGVGDFIGLTHKLDYLADLGVTAIWLLPFAPSPLRDDGYDIADYTNVHSRYGTLEDFQNFLDRAHAIGIRVITELVINHTSDQHPWFQRARRAAPGTPERDFYVWSDLPDKYTDVPLMFPDFETSNWAWDPIARQYYWHRFYSHQPDLNFDNPAVWDALLPVVDFWFERGVDGMRLDAVPYLFEREGTTCEHLPETHAFLKALRKHVDERFPNRMLLAEANAWPDDMVKYFGDSDECQMAFHFPLMPRLFMSLHQEDCFPLADILTQTPAIPADCQWCLFLRNHDELTLAMITDEERDAMYSAYTQDRQARLFLGIRHRLAPLLRNDRRRIELLNAILFSLPGTPAIYYGDEIGMGDNIYLGDRNGVRTPMQWSDDRNAGFSRASSQQLFLPVIVNSEYHYEAINVKTQQNNPSSLLWWTKRLIALRKRHPAFGRGRLVLLETGNSKVFVYLRETETEHILVVANFSRFVQHVELDLSAFVGMVPEELFGRTQFPAIKNELYSLSLGPYGFYWFALVPQKLAKEYSEDLPILRLNGWEELARGNGRDALATFLAGHHSASYRKQLVACRLLETLSIPIEAVDVRFFVIRLEYASGQFETLFQPLALVPEERFTGPEALPRSVAIGRTGPPRNAILCDPIAMPEYLSSLMTAVSEHQVISLGEGGELACVPFEGWTELPESDAVQSMPVVHVVHQHHLTVILGRHLVLRTFRRSDEGINPDVEIGRFLKQVGFTGFAEVVATIEHHRPGLEPTTLSALHRYIPNQGDAWQLLLDQASRFFDGVAAQSPRNPVSPTLTAVQLSDATEHADRWEHFVSPFLSSARAIGAFTARLHLALASVTTSSTISAIRYTSAYQRSFYQSLRNAAGRLHALLAEPDPAWPDAVRDLAVKLRAQDRTILNYIQKALNPQLASGQRIRVHGDFHLGQLLVAGQDFVLSDFEGNTTRSIGDRRVKRSPLHDVAAMMRSFNYVIDSVRLDLSDGPGIRQGVIRSEDRVRLEPYALAWLDRICAEFLEAYLSLINSTDLLPRSAEAIKTKLELLILERAFREAEFDLIERPEWAVIPLSAILRILETAAD